MTVSIAPPSAAAVSLLAGGGRIRAEVHAIKDRVITLGTRVFLPKNCHVLLELQGPGETRARVTGIVRKVQMVRTTPAYRVTVRLANGELESTAGFSSPSPSEADDGVQETEPIDLETGQMPRWAHYLLTAGIVTKAQLEEVGEASRRQGTTFGEALVEAGVAPDEAISRCLALDQCFCFVDLDDFDVRLSNAALIPEELARRNRVFPLFAIEGVITLAMGDPTNLALIDQIRLRANSQVDACMCSAAQLGALIERAYSPTTRPGSAQETPEPRGSEKLASPVHSTVGLVQSLIEDSARDGASDIHIEPERDELRIRIRVDGILHERPRSVQE